MSGAPRTTSILPASFLFLPSESHSRLFSDDFNHKVPLALKFKEKQGDSTMAIKCKVDYKGGKASLGDEVKYDTKILDKALHLRFKGTQVKAHLDGGQHQVDRVWLNPSLVLKGTRDMNRFKSVLGLVVSYQNLTFTARASVNQKREVVLSQRLLANYRGITLAETHVNNLSTNQHAFRSLLAYRKDKVEASVEVHREKKHVVEKTSDLSKLFLSLIYHHCPKLQVGVQFRENYQRSRRRFLAGASLKVNNDLSLKGKVDHYGKVSGSASYRLHKNLLGNLYFQARTVDRTKAVTPICQRLCLPLSIGTQFDWVN